MTSIVIYIAIYILISGPALFDGSGDVFWRHTTHELYRFHLCYYFKIVIDLKYFPSGEGLYLMWYTPFPSIIWTYTFSTNLHCTTPEVPGQTITDLHPWTVLNDQTLLRTRSLLSNYMS